MAHAQLAIGSAERAITREALRCTLASVCAGVPGPPAQAARGDHSRAVNKAGSSLAPHIRSRAVNT